MGAAGGGLTPWHQESRASGDGTLSRPHGCIYFLGREDPIFCLTIFGEDQMGPGRGACVGCGAQGTREDVFLTLSVGPTVAEVKGTLMSQDDLVPPAGSQGERWVP